MLTFFRKKNSPVQVAAEGLYAALIAQSRQPAFYTVWGVPDTVDGRFDSVLMHCFIVMHRLGHGDKDSRALSQALYDTMFVEMDRAVREMGVGDLSVKRHVRRMMKAFNGRVAAYEAGLADNALLHDVLRRNLYGTVPDVAQEALNRVGAYLLTSLERVMGMDMNELVAGRIVWADLPETPVELRKAAS
jgi:cytochrome b pre-mRNA-processing protein 3